jgi:FdhD protein
MDGVPLLDRDAVPNAVVQAPNLVRRSGQVTDGQRAVPEETAIAMTYNRTTHAVMMGTPRDLEDFAVGFSLAEGIISRSADIEELEVMPTPLGVELRMWVAEPLMAALEKRRRQIAGATGCGLCGMESLADTMQSPPAVRRGKPVPVADIAAAVAGIGAHQTLNHVTRAVHAAAFWRGGLVALREDVGRHNALDKLAGALMRQGEDPESGFLVMTSRISVELVQKAAVLGVSLLVAVSAPTALAIRVADTAGITLAGIARPDGFEVFTHPDGIDFGSEYAP